LSGHDESIGGVTNPIVDDGGKVGDDSGDDGKSSGKVGDDSGDNGESGGRDATTITVLA